MYTVPSIHSFLGSQGENFRFTSRWTAVAGGIFLTVIKVIVNLCTTDYFAVLSCLFLIRLCKCLLAQKCQTLWNFGWVKFHYVPALQKYYPKKENNDMKSLWATWLTIREIFRYYRALIPCYLGLKLIEKELDPWILHYICLIVSQTLKLNNGTFGFRLDTALVKEQDQVSEKLNDIETNLIR